MDKMRWDVGNDRHRKGVEVPTITAGGGGYIINDERTTMPVMRAREGYRRTGIRNENERSRIE